MGQIAIGEFVRAQSGFGRYVWSQARRDPEAVQHFTALLEAVKKPFGG